MPVDVMVEFVDGSTSTQRVGKDVMGCTFASDKKWRRVIVDPLQFLPDADRKDNAKTNPDVPPVFEITQLDLGDKAWGLNAMKFHVKTP